MTEKKWPIISIITACYNSSRTIEDTIRSVLSQSYPNIEYIIVDGSSTDNTMAIVEKYRHRIATVISEPDGGNYFAFNKGILASTGDVIYILNSDDYLYDSQVISDVAATFAQHPNVAMVYGDVENIEDTTGFFHVTTRELSFDDLRKGLMPHHPGFFVRKELFTKHGLFDVRYYAAADHDFILKCAITDWERSLYIKRPIAFFRLGGGGSHIDGVRPCCLEKREIVEKYFRVCIKGEDPQISVDNLPYYRLWLEMLLVHKKSISSVLKGAVDNVAIFGSMKPAIYLSEDCLHSGIKTKAFLDNDKQRVGRMLRGIPIHAPDWLSENTGMIDAVLLSFEANHDDIVIKQIADMRLDNQLPVISWKNLISRSIPAMPSNRPEW